jgi:hypothetical protein
MIILWAFHFLFSYLTIIYRPKARKINVRLEKESKKKTKYERNTTLRMECIREEDGGGKLEI